MTMPFTWSAEIAARAAALDAEVEALRSRPLTPAALRSLIAWLRLQHVYNSNAIEGNTLTLSETKVIVEDGLTVGGKSLREHAEAVNLAAAVDYILGLARAEDPPVDAALIRNLHLLVLRDINRDEAGRYRQEPVRISGSSYPTTEPLHLEEAMNEFDEWLTTEPEPRNAVLRAAIAHTWLVNIHPFIDGNGRVARLTMNILLLRAGYPLATIRKEDRPRYYDALERSHAGDLSEWVTLLAERVTDSIREYRRAQDEAERAEGPVTSLSQRYRETQAGPPPDYLMWHGVLPGRGGSACPCLQRQSQPRGSGATAGVGAPTSDTAGVAGGMAWAAQLPRTGPDSRRHAHHHTDCGIAESAALFGRRQDDDRDRQPPRSPGIAAMARGDSNARPLPGLARRG